jgi:serine/threonine-protein kinase
LSDYLERLKAALADTYAIEREVGAGGMATVYLAEDLKHRRKVAVKVLRPELASTIGGDRFFREIELAAQLTHPHILPLHDSGEADGFLYYVMPFIEGESLRQRLDREGELPVADAARIMREVVDALAAAHEAGVVHRDIKPDNVLLSGNHAIVTDFGVAKAVSEATGRQQITTAGVALGTPAYMAPEQAAASPNIDHRADIYAVGAMAYELLAGRPPFIGPTAQAVLAAHVTEAPDDVSGHRASIPPGMAAVIMKCLEKKPADRWQSSTELLAELEVVATPSGGITPAATRPVAAVGGRRRTWGVALATLGVVAIGAVAAVLMRAPTGITIDPDVVAVAPFDVLGDDLDLWSEGLVDILSRSLDGAGPLKTVSPTLVIRSWDGRAEPASAGQLGRATGAGLAVFGRLVGTSGDSVRLNASLLDVERGAVLGEIELRDAVDRLDRLADTLTVALLNELGRTRPIGAVRRTSFASPSFAATKYYLQGEQQYRKSNWDSARVFYQRAVELDSTFALALNRLSTVLGWQASLYDSMAVTYGYRAAELNHGLPPRESLLIVMDSLLHAVSSGAFAGAEFYGLVRRLFATSEDAVARYPRDPELWNATGEAVVHAGDLLNLPREEGYAAFRRAIELDSAFAPAYIHAIQYALELEGPEAALRHIDAYLALGPTDRHSSGQALVRRLLDPATASDAETELMLDTASAGTLASVQLTFWQYPDSAETALQAARRMAEGRPGLPPWNDPAAGREFTILQLTRRGHLEEAAGMLPVGGRMSIESANWIAFLDLVMLGGVDSERAAARFERWMREGSLLTPTAIWWFAERGDTAAIHELVAAVRESGGALGGAMDPYFEPASEAWLALARGDSARALDRFLTLPDSLCPVCDYERLARVRLLQAAGRDAEAALLLDQHTVWRVRSLAVVWALERARVNDRLGNADKAVQDYAFVVDSWHQADPELQPVVEEARAALSRLSGEPR